MTQTDQSQPSSPALPDRSETHRLQWLAAGGTVERGQWHTYLPEAVAAASSKMPVLQMAAAGVDSSLGPGAAPSEPESQSAPCYLGRNASVLAASVPPFGQGLGLWD